jgi:GAF domain-containing protein
VILLLQGTQLRTAAHHGRVFAAAIDRPATRDGVAGRAVIDRETIHLPDVLEADDFPLGQQLSRADGSRTVLATPLMREGVAIGAILIRRGEVRPFSDKQVKLLQTFADQAVIAIENVRLFKELEARNNELKVALEQQTATSEILHVISRSPTDEQPVFDAIVQSARQLCEATFSCVCLIEAGQLTLAAVQGVDSAGIAAIHTAYPRPVDRDTTSGRDPWIGASCMGGLVARPRVHPSAARHHRPALHSHRPHLSRGLPIGAVSVWRGEVRPFTDKQIALLQTFADQAMIAIENVRLFTELEARNAKLTDSLARQTATAEVLRVDRQLADRCPPVFDAIVRSAMHLLGGHSECRLSTDQGRGSSSRPTRRRARPETPRSQTSSLGPWRSSPSRGGDSRPRAVCLPHWQLEDRFPAADPRTAPAHR